MSTRRAETGTGSGRASDCQPGRRGERRSAHVDYSLRRYPSSGFGTGLNGIHRLKVQGCRRRHHGASAPAEAPSRRRRLGIVCTGRESAD
ncbi:MAG: hypothetical protein AAF675_08695 [Pseudomonadota bacterium]